jgi:hypothetical protein
MQKKKRSHQLQQRTTGTIHLRLSFFSSLKEQGGEGRKEVDCNAVIVDVL